MTFYDVSLRKNQCSSPDSLLVFHVRVSTHCVRCAIEIQNNFTIYIHVTKQCL
jgi:hypothetical protein